MSSISRNFATAAKVKPQFNVFDRSAKLLQRSRTPKLDPGLSRKKEYLRDEVAIETIERLAFITRPFDKALDFGCHSGNLLKQLCTKSYVSRQLEGDEIEEKIIDQLNKDKDLVRAKIKDLVLFDSSKELLDRDIDQKLDFQFPGTVTKVVGDEEKFDHEILKKSDVFDLVVSNLSLHWINDLPQSLANINRILKPDGLFMGTLFGGDTLYELRTSLQLAELERNKAGFSILTIDSEDIVVGGFPDIVSICEDLQAMGEQNAVLSRAHNLPKDVLLAANQIYKSLHGEVQPDGQVLLPATFNIIFMIGWKKSDTQPQPLQRGTGEVNLKEVLQ